MCIKTNSSMKILMQHIAKGYTLPESNMAEKSLKHGDVSLGKIIGLEIVNTCEYKLACLLMTIGHVAYGCRRYICPV